MRIRTFQGLVPIAQHVSEVAAVQFDTVNREGASALASNKPLSLLHVERAEIDIDPGIDPYSGSVYAKAQDNFIRLQAQGVLVRESKPTMYLYRQTVGGHSQAGIVTVCHTEDYEKDIIKRHKNTRRDRELDRTNLLDKLDANTSPVLLAYHQRASISTLIEDFMQSNKAINDFISVDGVRHQVWRLSFSLCVSLTGLFESQVPFSYIADGHDYAASAFRVSQFRRKANPKHIGNENYNWFLCVLFPISDLKILPYNRVVTDLNRLGREEYLKRVSEVFTVKPTSLKVPTHPGQCYMYLKSQWYELTWEAAKNGSLIDNLEVSILQDRLLKPVLGIDDPLNSKRIDFIGGIRGTAELEKLVNSQLHTVAFSMYPTSIDQFITIANAGQRMPPKSTWFEPKLRSGLFIHTLQE
jgi:uncharacterized protein (DUF1015 family)